MVRSQVPPRLPEGTQLRRVLDRMGEPRKEPHRETGPGSPSHCISLSEVCRTPRSPLFFVPSFPQSTLGSRLLNNEMSQVSLRPPLYETLTRQIGPTNHLNKCSRIIRDDMDNPSNRE